MVAILFVVFVLLLVLSVPIALVLALSGLIGLLVLQPNVPLSVMALRIFGGINSFTLLAIPFFILTGELMQQGGMTLRLVNFARVLVGHIRGGLAHAVVVSAIFFSGISGSTTADAAALGAVLIPAMVKSKYTPEKAVSVICAASGMGPLIPPSLSMIVYGSLTGISIAGLFAAGLLPALVMAVALMVQIYLQSKRDNVPVDPLPDFARVKAAAIEASLPLLLPVIIFGGILGGVFTPTEAAVVAVIYALILCRFVYKTIRLSELPAIFAKTGRLTGAVMLMIATASLFSWVLSIEQVPQTLATWTKLMGADRNTFLMASVLIFLFLFAVLDGLPAMLMVIPIFVPIAAQFGVSAFHYGIIMFAVTGIALFLPPVGVGLFIAMNFADTTVPRVAPTLLSYHVTMFIVCILITYVPWITEVIPRLLHY